MCYQNETQSLPYINHGPRPQLLYLWNVSEMDGQGWDHMSKGTVVVLTMDRIGGDWRCDSQGWKFQTVQNFYGTLCTFCHFVTSSHTDVRRLLKDWGVLTNAYYCGFSPIV